MATYGGNPSKNKFATKAKLKSDPDEASEDPKEEATETPAQEKAEESQEADAPKGKASAGGNSAVVAAIEKRKGPVGPGHHNSHRTAALMKWLQSKEASKKGK